MFKKFFSSLIAVSIFFNSLPLNAVEPDDDEIHLKMPLLQANQENHQEESQTLNLMSSAPDVRNLIYEHIAHNLTRNDRNSLLCVSKKINEEYLKVEKKVFEDMINKVAKEHDKRELIMQAFPDWRVHILRWHGELRAYPFRDDHKDSDEMPKTYLRDIKQEATILINSIANWTQSCIDMNCKYNIEDLSFRYNGKEYSSIRAFFIPKKPLEIYWIIPKITQDGLSNILHQNLVELKLNYYQGKVFSTGKHVLKNLALLIIESDVLEKVIGIGHNTPKLKEFTIIYGYKKYPPITHIKFDGPMPNLGIVDFSDTNIWDIEGWEYLNLDEITVKRGKLWGRFTLPEAPYSKWPLLTKYALLTIGGSVISITEFIILTGLSMSRIEIGDNYSIEVETSDGIVMLCVLGVVQCLVLSIASYLAPPVPIFQKIKRAWEWLWGDGDDA